MDARNSRFHGDPYYGCCVAELYNSDRTHQTRNHSKVLTEAGLPFVPIVGDRHHQSSVLACRDQARTRIVRQLHHPNSSFGMGLCQLPSEAIIVSASFGPQLLRL
jgi:hypothetical protein